MRSFGFFSSLVILSQVVLLALAGPAPHTSLLRRANGTSSTNLTVTLPNYGSFVGTHINKTLTNLTLPQTVDAWLGISYANQPILARRFRPVTWPRAFSGVKNATSYGPVCIQDPKGTPLPQSEACLSFNVYRTPGVPFDQKLPVLVFIHGGSFTSGSGLSFDGAAFVAMSKVPLMAVTFQYRLGSLGSLPSQLFADKGLLNLGIRDQRLFLEFVNKYIEYFGGDPAAVTLGGQSAGAHSVGIHYAHNYGDDAEMKPLFARAFMASGGYTARAFPNVTYPPYEQQFTQYMTALQCPMDDETSAMECLRRANITAIQTIQTQIYNAYLWSDAWPFQPVSNAQLIEEVGSISGIEGTFFHVPLLTTSNTDEGTGFSPFNLTSDAAVLSFMKNLGPRMTDDDMQAIDTLYPDPIQFPDSSPYANSTNSTEYSRISAMYGDYAYICPVQENAFRSASAGVPTWMGRFNTPNLTPAWVGVPHGSDIGYINGLPDTRVPTVSVLYHAYYASFVASGDPNTFKLDGAPEWMPYTVASGYGGAATQMRLVVSPTLNATKMEVDDIREEQCQFWRDPERMLRLDK